jgi:hypothetical protein
MLHKNAQTGDKSVEHSEISSKLEEKYGLPYIIKQIMNSILLRDLMTNFSHSENKLRKCRHVDIFCAEIYPDWIKCVDNMNRNLSRLDKMCRQYEQKFVHFH